jgi:hypothetical protein
MWTALRESTRAHTDEDRAMAYVNYGSSETRTEARALLIEAIRSELFYHANQSEHYLSPECIIRLATILGTLIGDRSLNVSEHDGLRFQIREYGVRS